jgi:hypothetical protein
MTPKHLFGPKRPFDKRGMKDLVEIFAEAERRTEIAEFEQAVARKARAEDPTVFERAHLRRMRSGGMR